MSTRPYSNISVSNSVSWKIVFFDPLTIIVKGSVPILRKKDQSLYPVTFSTTDEIIGSKAINLYFTPYLTIILLRRKISLTFGQGEKKKDEGLIALEQGSMFLGTLVTKEPLRQNVRKPS